MLIDDAFEIHPHDLLEQQASVTLNVIQAWDSRRTDMLMTLRKNLD